MSPIDDIVKDVLNEIKKGFENDVAKTLKSIFYDPFDSVITTIKDIFNKFIDYMNCFKHLMTNLPKCFIWYIFNLIEMWWRFLWNCLAFLFNRLGTDISPIGDVISKALHFLDDQLYYFTNLSLIYPYAPSVMNDCFYCKKRDDELPIQFMEDTKMLISNAKKNIKDFGAYQYNNVSDELENIYQYIY